MRIYLRYAVLLLVISMVFLVSCGKKEKTASAVFDSFISEIEMLPEGTVFRSGSAEGSGEYLSESLCTTLYGERAVTDIFPLIEDYSIYLCSFAYPFEAAVFKCYSKSDADFVAEMCFLRGDMVKVLLHSEGVNDVEVKVMIKGRFVAMYIGTKPEEAARAFDRAMR